MSLVSIVYRSGRKPINKQALNSILPHEDERRVKKKKRKIKNRGKSRVVRVVKTRKSSVEAGLARRGEVKLSRVRDIFDGDVRLLRNEGVEKVDYVVVGVDVGRKFARAHVPEQFFGGHVGLCGLVVEFDMAAQLPEVLVVEPGTVGCDVQVDLELVVIAFDEDAFGELPSGRVGLVEHPPFLGDDFVAYDTRIGYELAHAVRHHDR